MICGYLLKSIPGIALSEPPLWPGLHAQDRDVGSPGSEHVGEATMGGSALRTATRRVNIMPDGPSKGYRAAYALVPVTRNAYSDRRRVHPSLAISKRQSPSPMCPVDRCGCACRDRGDAAYNRRLSQWLRQRQGRHRWRQKNPPATPPPGQAPAARHIKQRHRRPNP